MSGGGFQTKPRAGVIAKRMIEHAEVVVRQKTAGAVDAFVFVRLAKRKTALKTLFDLRQAFCVCPSEVNSSAS